MSPLPVDVCTRAAIILVVDDVADNRELLELILVRAGYLVETAATGEEALDSVARQMPDLVLLDLMLPGMNGHEVMATLKASPLTRAMPIIMVSAHSSRADRLRAMEAGAEDVLAKPLRHLELCARVRLALTSRTLLLEPVVELAAPLVPLLAALPCADGPGLPPRFS